MADSSMRVDRFLWFARIVKTREQAQALAEEGHLRMDGRTITRSSAQVRVGSVLTFAYHGRVRAIRVTALPGRRGPPADAAACIDDLIPGVDASAVAT